MLLGQVQAQAKAAYALEIPLAEASDQSTSARWVLTISRLQIGTTLTEPDARVALVVLAHLDVSPHGAATPSSGADYRVESDAKRTAPEWAAGEGALARREIDELMAQVATRMLVDLSASR